jgi:undecaprenyl diphosphate synthase
MSAVPKHIAIIMDGNGRWAQQRGLPRTAGHRQGAETLRRVLKAAGELGVEYLTLFGFSSENWARPESEITELMRLLRYYLHSETAELHKSGVKLKVIGDRVAFDPDIVQMIENAESLTALNEKITLIIALNYGGRNDILHAVHKTVHEFATRGIDPSFSQIEKHFPDFLMTAGIPDPDVLVRTSGEKRISNFLLWQCAYAELFFTPTLWPDFNKSDLEKIIAEYAQRERRFGALKQSGQQSG